MSDNQNIPINQLRLFSTAPHPCSYLDEEATTLFIDPDAAINLDTFSYLNERGFRRSGNHIYRPNCLNCQACMSYRLKCKAFKLSKSQKRVLSKASKLNFEISAQIQTSTHYSLYQRYINARHKDGDMYPASKEQFDSFINNHLGSTFFLNAYDQEKLVACAVIDQVFNGLSAVYTFFEPEYTDTSLGKLMILKEVELAQNAHLDHLYLGYWIKSSEKMQYKADYRPGEIFLNKRWIGLKP